MRIEDFWILVQRSGPAHGPSSAPAFQVRTRTSAGEGAVVPLTLPTRETLDRMGHLFGGGSVRDVRGTGTGEDREALVQRVGRELFESVFQGEAGQQFSAIVGRSRRPSKLLRLMVSLPLGEPESGVLQELPWEALWSRRNGDFLALEPCFSIVRHVEQASATEPPPRPPVLRVLAVSAGPLPDLEPLHLDREAAALRDAFGQADDVEVDVEEGLSLPRLSNLLEERRPHVLHLMGHGGFDEAQRRGYLALPDGWGGVDRVDGERLARALKNSVWRRETAGGEHGPGLQLVVLNACRTARAVAEAPFAGIATALVRQGDVPAVLAMQYPVRDEAAILFSEELYGRLAKGTPLEEAVYQGRLRLSRDGFPDWIAPALFSRLPGGRLFAEEAAPGAGASIPPATEAVEEEPAAPAVADEPATRRGDDPGVGRLRNAGILAAALLAMLLVLANWGLFGGRDGAPPEESEESASELVSKPAWELDGESEVEGTREPRDPEPREPEASQEEIGQPVPPGDEGGGTRVDIDPAPEAVEPPPDPIKTVEETPSEPPPSQGPRQVNMREGESVSVAGGFLFVSFPRDLSPDLVTLRHSRGRVPRAAGAGKPVIIETPDGPLEIFVASVDSAAGEAVVVLQ